MKLNEIKKYTTRDLFDKEMGTDSMEVYSEFHDFVIPWVNNNSKRAIDRAIKRPEFVKLSRLMFYKKFFTDIKSYDNKIEPDLFDGYQDKTITLWRGGGGIYDVDKNATWVSFTAQKDRVNTFSEYHGTHGKHGFLDKRSGSQWVVELHCKISDILIYIEHGGDEEVIVSGNIAKQAKVIKQT